MLRAFYQPEPISYSSRRIILALAAALALMTVASKAMACAACGCTLSKDWEAQGMSSKPGFTTDLSYDYLNQNQQRYGSSAASSSLINSQLANGQEIEDYTKTQTLTASLIYNDMDWGVSMQIPYVRRDHATYGNTQPLGSTHDTSTDSSIGDIRIIGRYTGWSAAGRSGIIAGVKLPTGSTNATFSDGVTPLDAGLQIGTGSTDIILGGYTTGAIDRYGWFLQGTVQHAVLIRTLNGATYRPGDAYSISTGIRYAGFAARVSPMLQLNMTRREADTDGGTQVNVPLDPVTGTPVSGGTLVYLAPGVSVRAGAGVSVYGFVQLPIYQYVNSLQIVPRYTLTLGMRKSFDD